MKEYGQADVMCAVIHIFLERHNELTDEQKRDIEDKCCEDVTNNYPTAAEYEISI